MSEGKEPTSFLGQVVLVLSPAHAEALQTMLDQYHPRAKDPRTSTPAPALPDLKNQ